MSDERRLMSAIDLFISSRNGDNIAMHVRIQFPSQLCLIPAFTVRIRVRENKNRHWCACVWTLSDDLHSTLTLPFDGKWNWIAECEYFIFYVNFLSLGFANEQLSSEQLITNY